MSTEDKTLAVQAACPFGCGTVQTIHVVPSEYEAWKSGALIQNALVSNSTDEREALMTGICSKCWEKMFS